MKRIILTVILMTTITAILNSQKPDDPSKWSKKKIREWFSKGAWADGWKIVPDSSIDKNKFAISYFRLKERWDKAFSFLKNNDLSKLEVRRYDIDGNNLYALVSEYTSKNEETTDFEAHKKYVDIQYVINGKELINIAPLSAITKVKTPYDQNKDIEFISVNKLVYHKASPEKFFIFFPSDAHRPGLKDGPNAPVKKLVIKLKVD